MKHIIFLIFLLFLGCSKDNEIWSFNNKIFGTYYVVKVQRDGSKLDKDKLGEQIHNLLNDLNTIYSTYDPNSELSLLNKLETNTPMQLSSTLKEVLDLSVEVNKLTQGGFDVTVGPLVNAWGFGPDGIRKKPRKEDVLKLLSSTGMNKFELGSTGKFQKFTKDLYIDLSAVAKGHAVDRVIEFLKDNNFKNAMVEIGGEVRTIGKKDGNNAWRIGIELPTKIRGGGVHKVLPIVDMAIATSGSYRNFIRYGQEVFNHTIDPRNGEPTKHKLISISILSKDCATADAIATGIMVLGPEKGFQLVEKEKIMAYFLIQKNDSFETLSSTTFNEYLKRVKD